MTPVYLPPTPPRIVFERRAEKSASKWEFTGSTGGTCTAAVLQFVVDNAPTVAVSPSGRMTAQQELMDLPTIEVRSQRSFGLARGKMIVMRKRA